MATIAKPFFSVSTITRELRATCRSDRDQQCFNRDSDSENPLAWSVGCVCVCDSMLWPSPLHTLSWKWKLHASRLGKYGNISKQTKYGTTSRSGWSMGTAVDDLSPQDWTVAAQWSEAVPSRTLGTSSASLEQARCEDFQAWVTWLGGNMGESCELWHHFSDI